MTTFVDLSGKEPVEVTVLPLRDLAFKLDTKVIGPVTNRYTLGRTLQAWHENAKVATPKPAFTFQDTEYWKPEQVSEWEIVYSREIGAEGERREAKLKADKVTKQSLVDSLITLAEHTARRNRGCYKGNRGNGLGEGRERVTRLSAVIEFVNDALGETEMSNAQRAKITALHDAAVQSVTS